MEAAVWKCRARRYEHPTARVTGSRAVSWYLADAQISVQSLTDIDGMVQVGIVYDAVATITNE
jgi:hypothetical protein